MTRGLAARTPVAVTTGLRQIRAFGSRHVVFLSLMAAGIFARIVVSLAYRPALVFFDSVTYLRDSREFFPHPARPLGYGAFLRALLSVGDLAAVPAAQHIMGLLIAVLLYVVLLRLRVRPWIAALATAPVLLDGFQLNMEQYVLSETLFELLLVAACVVLVWRRRPTVGLACIAGLLFALAALTRSVALVVLAPALLATVMLAPRRPWPALALVVAFAVPIVGYAFWFQAQRGEFALSGYGGQFLYARVAPIADCSKFSVPPDERVLCPREPLDRRLSIAAYMWSRSMSPVYRVPGDLRDKLAGRFARRVIRHQPLAYLKAVADDTLHAFGTTAPLKGDDAPTQWKFALSYPIYEPDTVKTLHRYGYPGGEVNVGLARPLRSYQRVVFAHGPLLAAGLIVALLAIAGLGRARRSGLRVATFLFAGVGLTVLVGAVAAHEYTWRYRLPLVVFIPAAAALGVTALIRAADGDRDQVVEAG